MASKIEDKPEYRPRKALLTPLLSATGRLGFVDKA